MQFKKSGRFLALQVPKVAVRQLDIEGVLYDDDQVRFDAKYYDEGLATIAASAITSSVLRVPTLELRSRRRMYEPGKDELDLINERHRNRREKYAADELFIYERYPANSIPSRSIRLRFTDRALGKMALDAMEGRSRLMYHNDAAVVGRAVFGEVVKETIRGYEAAYLRTIEYIPRTAAKQNVIEDVEAGILSYDSVGVNLGRAVKYVDLEDENGQFSIIEVDFDSEDRSPLDLQEISFVHLGELYGVGSKNSAGSGAAVDVSGQLVQTGTLLQRAEAALSAGVVVDVSDRASGGSTDRQKPVQQSSNKGGDKPPQYSEITWRSF